MTCLHVHQVQAYSTKIIWHGKDAQNESATIEKALQETGICEKLDEVPRIE